MLPQEHRPVYLETLAYQRLRQLQREPPSQARMIRLITSALHQYEQTFFTDTAECLSPVVKEKLQQLIYQKRELNRGIDLNAVEDDDPSRYPLHDLKTGPGAAKVKQIKTVADRLKLLQAIALPDDLFTHVPLRFVRQYHQQAAVESISHLQRHQNKDQTYTLLAAFCWVRQREITDQLVELFIQILGDIRLRAEQRIAREILSDVTRVEGKQHLLYRLAEAMWDHPEGIINQVLYPLVGKARLRSLVQEAKTKGTYRQIVQTRVSGSYTHHYRQMLPPLLAVLTFRSNNDQYKPLIDALQVVAEYLQDKDPFYPQEQPVPMTDVIQKQWQRWIYQADQAGQQRIRRVRYELCVLQSLREKLRCKEIWVEGADRYRNPDEDVPADFGDQRETYYTALNLPLDATDFVSQVKSQLEQALQTFNDDLPSNPDVEILDKSNGWIRLSPLDKQPEPTNLRYLKHEIRQRWWMTSLLDILKEVDLQVGFTDNFHSLTGQERLPSAELQKRLLLCLFGLGTNTGLSSVSMGHHGISYANLQYVRRRFVAKEALRKAISQVVDATLAIRQPEIWGETTTWCASDAKQFGAWSQNLLTGWHKRYRKAGVMVYWRTPVRAFICSGGSPPFPANKETAHRLT